MALLDFLKRKKEIEKAKPEQKPEKISPVRKSSGSEGGVKKPAEISAKQKIQAGKSKGFSYDVVKMPHISEKATYLAEKDQYTFKVYENVNKYEIKKAVEGIYGVDVLSVNMIKIPGKKRRLGKTQGFKRGHKKAIVTIKSGQKIEIL